MARDPNRGQVGLEVDVDALSADVRLRFDDVPWKLFDSRDLASSGETRFMVSRIQADLMKVAAANPTLAAQIWDDHVPTFVPRPADLPELAREGRSLNGIEPGRRRRRPALAEAYLDGVTASKVAPVEPEVSGSEPKSVALQPPGKASERRRDAAAKGTLPDDARVRLLLEGLNKQYLKADDTYHFRDKSGEVAFVDQQKKLVTDHDTPSVVASMIDLAEARGWASLKLSGTIEFRREAWLQARVRHLDVSGYQPTALDKAKLDELQGERIAHGPVNGIAEQKPKPDGRASLPGFGPVLEDGKEEPKIPLTPTQDQFLRLMEATMRHRGDAPEAIVRARELANERLTSDRVYLGKLVEVGTAPYQDKAGEKPGPFVTLENSQGQIAKVWGADLPRALGAAKAETGQVVAIAFKGRRPVIVDVPVKDQGGTVLRTERQTVERNTWEIVPFERLRQTAKASVLKAVHRQDNPAELKIFDRTARLVPSPLDLTRQPGRGRERTI